MRLSHGSTAQPVVDGELAGYPGGDGESGGRALESGVVAKAQVRLGDADRQFVEAQARVELDLLFGLGGIFHALAAIHFRDDNLDFFLDALFQRIKKLEVAGLLARRNHGFAKIDGSRPAQCQVTKARTASASRSSAERSRSK